MAIKNACFGAGADDGATGTRAASAASEDQPCDGSVPAVMHPRKAVAPRVAFCIPGQA